MTDAERIDRLEYVLGSLIVWLHGTSLNYAEAKQLLEMLADFDVLNLPEVLRRKR